MDSDRDKNRERIEQFIRTDLPLNVIAFIMVGIVYLVYRPEFLLPLDLMVVANTAAVLVARWLVQHGRLEQAVGVMCISVEAICVVSAFTVPQLFPMIILLTIWPMALALPYIGRKPLLRLMALSTVVSLIVSILSLRSDPFGIGAAVPQWVLDGTNVVLVPLFTGLLFLMLWHYSTRLNETVAQVQASERSLELKVALRTTELEQKNEELQSSEHELAVARDEALDASRAKTSFLANASHEIRTPMNAIIGMTDVLSETPLSQEQREYIRIIRDAGDTLLSLIGDVLDLSKVEAGRLELEQIEFDLDDVLDRTLEFVAPKAHEKGLELVSHVTAGTPTRLVGDPDRLGQILMNLVGNSVKFTEAGEVVVEVRTIEGEDSDRQMLEFSVRDSGIGIPSNRISRIFETFAQAESSTTRKYGGTGLGLAICKQLAELMGGRIWAQSTLGQGSTLRFTAQFGSAATSFEPPSLPPQVQGMRVLVVDDSPTNRELVRELLSSGGMVVRDTSTSQDAMATLRQAQTQGDPFALVVLDGQMPDVDGFTTAELIASDLSLETNIVMMLTSDRRRSNIDRCRELGVACHVVKPIKRDELFEAVSVAVGAAEPKPEVDEQAREEAARVQRPLRILVAEDTPDNTTLVRLYLRDTPHHIDVVEDGQAAVEKFETSAYDLVLMDVQMPILDGYAATRAIRHLETKRQLQPTPIIALTAYALPEEIEQSFEAGFTAHLTKPIRKHALLSAIAHHSADTDPVLLEGSSDGHTTIEVDPDLADLIPEYLEHRREDAAAIAAALELCDYEAIRILGHSMRGSGAAYGFEALTSLGNQVEQAAKAGEADKLRAILGQLSYYLAHVELRVTKTRI